MTNEEAIYCMMSYLPDDRIEHCINCPYYGCNKIDEQISICKSSEAHKMAIKALEQTTWIPVSEKLPELNRPLLVTAYHRVCYAHMISESGNYGYPVFRLHEIKYSDRGWVQETISHEPYSKGRIDAWMYIDIPEPYKPQESEGEE